MPAPREAFVRYKVRHHPSSRRVIRDVREKFAEHAGGRCVQCSKRLVQASDGYTARKQSHQGDLAPAARRKHEQLLAEVRVQFQRRHKIPLQISAPQRALLLY